MNAIQEYIKQKKNIEIVCQTSDCLDQSLVASVFVVFKHLKYKNEEFYVSIREQVGLYDVEYDCSRGVLSMQFGNVIKDMYDDEPKMITDVKTMIDFIDDKYKPSSMISMCIEYVNASFTHLHTICGVKEFLCNGGVVS
jgi:hypothetical protein